MKKGRIFALVINNNKSVDKTKNAGAVVQFGQNACLSRRRSRVRVSSAPPNKASQSRGFFVFSWSANLFCISTYHGYHTKLFSFHVSRVSHGFLLSLFWGFHVSRVSHETFQFPRITRIARNYSNGSRLKAQSSKNNS